MTRLFLFLLAGLLLSCGKQPLFTSLPATFAQAVDTARAAHPGQPVVVVVEGNKKGQITLQVGTANQAAATGTDNTGRAARDGANGGQQTVTDNGPGVLPLALLGLLTAAGGWLANDKWRAWRARPG